MGDFEWLSLVVVGWGGGMGRALHANPRLATNDSREVAHAVRR